MPKAIHAPTVVTSRPYIELDNGKQTVRFDLTAEQHQLGRNSPWADFAVPDEGWEVISRQHARLVLEGQDYRIFDGNGNTASRNGLFQDQRRIDGQKGHLLSHGKVLKIGLDPRNLVRLTYYNPTGTQETDWASVKDRTLDLQSVTQWPVFLGRSGSERYATFELPSPTVSRNHALIQKRGDQAYEIRDNYSTNGTFVNGEPISGWVPLEDSSLITIGPFQVLFAHQQLQLQNDQHQIRLDAHNIVREIQVKGKKHRILNEVSLPIEPGQLVALVGGSGAGKSTLMKALLGIVSLQSGQVYLNGIDLQHNFAMYRTQIGYVPQDDIIHPQLRVVEVLQFTCQLRLPPDTNPAPLIEKVLQQVQLTHVKDHFVRDLSGGQRKRVSIAVELLADPKLFFLDEPTSGLDPGLDKQMMALLRRLANEGRTIILVTHATTNLDCCDRIAFMGRGGYLCFYGPPQDAMEFFQMPAPDLKYFSDVYIKLDQNQEQAGVIKTVSEIVQGWSQHFRQSPLYDLHVQQTLSAGHQNSETTTQKSQKSQESQKKSAKSPLLSVAFPSLKFVLRQLGSLTQRYQTLMLRDRFSLGLGLLTIPLVLCILKLALVDHNPFVIGKTLDPEQAPLALQVLFIFSCLSIWVGLSSSVQAIVKEASIYYRERLVNLGILPYLGSKVVVHGGLAFVQTLLMVITVLLLFQSPEPKLLPWAVGLGMTSFITLGANISLGLMISSWIKTEDQGNNLLPLIMLFQMILSGVPFKLEGWSTSLSFLTLSRWSTHAYAALVNLNAMIPDAVTLPNGETLPRVVEVSHNYEATWQNLGECWWILVLHSGVYLGMALLGLKLKDSQNR
jgi:ABC-type multidrug transport system ATPase subunit